MVDQFFQLETLYKHMAYEDIWKCIGFGDTHVFFQSQSQPIELAVPKVKRHKWMYKKVSGSVA